MTDRKGKFIRLYNWAVFNTIDTSNNRFAKDINRWLEEKVKSGNSTFSQDDFISFLITGIKENIKDEDKKLSTEYTADSNKNIPGENIIKKEPASVIIKELSIKGFRKFVPYSDCTFILKEIGEKTDNKSNNIPQSWFLIGENGIGKSSIYSALEYVITRRISEGEFRNEDFTLQAERAIFKLTTNEGTFMKEKELKDFYNGNSMLAIFCSEYDIFQIGQKSNNNENMALFASMMGYDDIIEIIYTLKSFVADQKKETGTLSSDAKERLDKEIQILDSQNKERLKKLVGQYVLPSYKRNKTEKQEIQESNLIRQIYKPLQRSLRTKKRSKLIRQITNLNNLYNRYKKICLDPAIKEPETLTQYEGLTIAFEELSALLTPSPTKKGQINLEDSPTPFYIQAHSILQKINDTLLLCMSNIPLIQTVKKYLMTNAELELKKKQIESYVISENLLNIQNYITLIERKLYETIKDEYEPYKDFITCIMEKFNLSSENFRLYINFKENNLEIMLQDESKEGIKQELSPSAFYNSFRYKLFCLLLRIACGLAYMKKRKIRIPIILDDVFYGSDFYSRTHVKQFFEILMDQIKTLKEGKEDEQNNFIQIICFTHDEVIFNAIMDVMMSMENKDYIKPIFGRIIDAEQAKQTMRNKKEGGIYINFLSL